MHGLLCGVRQGGGEAGRILLLPPAGLPYGEVAPGVGPWCCQAAPGTHGCPRAGRYSPCPVHFGSWQQPRAALKVENAGAWRGAALRWCWAGGAALALCPPPPAALWCTGRQRGRVLAPLPRAGRLLRSPTPCNPQEGVQPPQNPIPPIDLGCPIPSLAPTTHPKAGAAPGSCCPPSTGVSVSSGGGRRRSCSAPRCFPFPELAAERHQVALTAPSAAGGARFTVNLLQRVNKPASANWH